MFLLDPFVIDGEVATYCVEISNMESSPTMVYPDELEGGEAFILHDLAKCMNECGLGILTRDLSNQECGSVCLGACYGLRTLESLLFIGNYKICNGLLLFKFDFK